MRPPSVRPPAYFERNDVTRVRDAALFNSHLFRHPGKLYGRLSFHFAHDLAAMHLDCDFTAFQLGYRLQIANSPLYDWPMTAFRTCATKRLTTAVLSDSRNANI